MEFKAFLPFIISGLSLLVSIVALYMGQFRRSKLGIIPGPDVHMYYPRNGGTGFYIPLIFTNKSPTRGVIEEIFLEITNPQGRVYQMLWLEEVKITIRTWEYDHIDRAKPFTIGGHETVSKAFWFHWPDHEESLDLKPGTYNVNVLAAVNRKETPTIRVSRQLVISGDSASALIARREQQDSITIIHYFKGDSLIAKAWNAS